MQLQHKNYFEQKTFKFLTSLIFLKVGLLKRIQLREITCLGSNQARSTVITGDENVPHHTYTDVTK